ncbi:MAG: hypothetical protein PF637_02445 [Spirochaetes bacterium]|jgi:ribonuclease HI|nr:hypothetical protein [Spirochaetota bacterium]
MSLTSVVQENFIIEIYTDGSCNPAGKLGAWAAIILMFGEEIVLSGTESTSSHNAMELLAAIKALEHVAAIKALEHVAKMSSLHEEIVLYSDSQYVVGAVTRMDALIADNFITGKGTVRKNKELLKTLFLLIQKLSPHFYKVAAHQKKTAQRNINREVDKLARKLVRKS